MFAANLGSPNVVVELEVVKLVGGCRRLHLCNLRQCQNLLANRARLLPTDRRLAPGTLELLAKVKVAR